MADFKFNNPKLEHRRRDLRQNMPQPEILLWAKLRNRQVNGHKFKRQYSLGGYILDFYCAESKLAVEIDGDSHFSAEGKAHDAVREKYLRDSGVRTVRFTNDEVMGNIEGVLDTIVKAIENNTPNTSNTSPSLS